MSRAQGTFFLLGLVLVGCQSEAHVTPHQAVDPPVSSPKSIPDAALFGTIRGQSFQLQDARYIPDHRGGFERVDIKLSAGKADEACGDVKPSGSTSIWLRQEGSDTVESQELTLKPGEESRWSVHYQVHGEDGWIGNTDASAVVSLHAAGPDGRITGGIAVCFADDQKSCVSGSFAAAPCPYRIDAAPRGAIPPEAIPEKYKQKLKAAPTASPTDAPTASPTAAPTAAPTASPTAAPTAAPTTSAKAPPAPGKGH